MPAWVIRISFISLTCFTLSSSLFAASYPINTFTIKPISLSMLNLPSGKVKESTQLEGVTIDAFKAAPTFIVGESEKFNRGYSLEFGYLIFKNIEWIARISYIEDKAQGHVLWAKRTPAGDFFGPAYGYEFESRTSWAIATGINHYFDTFHKWLPFIGLSGGIIFQEATKADVHFTNAITQHSLGNLGNVTLQESKQRFKGAIHLGTDFRIDDRWVMSFATGLHYLASPATTYTNFQGRTIPFRDNDNRITIPFTVSLKMVFA